MQRFPRKHEDLSLDPQHLCLKLGAGIYPLNPAGSQGRRLIPALPRQSRGCLGVAGQPVYLAVRDPRLKEYGGEAIEDAQQTQMHTHTTYTQENNTCIHIYTHTHRK